MNKEQELLNKAWKVLSRRTRSAVSGGTCVIRDPETGCKCFVGAVIAPEDAIRLGVSPCTSLTTVKSGAMYAALRRLFKKLGVHFEGPIEHPPLYAFLKTAQKEHDVAVSFLYNERKDNRMSKEDWHNVFQNIVTCANEAHGLGLVHPKL